MIDLNSESIYNPDFFTPTDLENAKQIVLGHGTAESDNRWVVETNWNKQLFKSRNFLTKDSIVLDWGVGIGRLSKMMIDTWGCKVVGVDINQTMLTYAKEYVNNDDLFVGMTVEEFKDTNSFRFTNVVSVWVFQHSITIEEDLDLIKSRTIRNGMIFTFNEPYFYIPIISSTPGMNWTRTGNVLESVQTRFSLVEKGLFPKILNLPENQNNQTWAFLVNNKTV